MWNILDILQQLLFGWNEGNLSSTQYQRINTHTEIQLLLCFSQVCLLLQCDVLSAVRSRTYQHHYYNNDG